ATASDARNPKPPPLRPARLAPRAPEILRPCPPPTNEFSTDALIYGLARALHRRLRSAAPARSPMHAALDHATIERTGADRVDAFPRTRGEARMNTIQLWLGRTSTLVWGTPMIVLLLGTGVYLTILLRGIQFRELRRSLWLALIKRREEGAEGDISHYQALMTALAATVGVGNIAGVATAIAAGGPGALFWMWITGIFGMATKYAEAVLGVRYRTVDPYGNLAGGPMYYLSRGIGGPFGKTLGTLFARFAAVAAFGIGNMVQSNSVADALRSSFGVPPAGTGGVIAVLAGLVILGGIRSIGRVTAFFVPSMIVFYLVGGLIVLAIN